MNILVTGGAGYIGSHAARMLARDGYNVWIYDNLSRGHRQAALPGRLIEGDVGDFQRVTDVLREKQIDAVMHFAAFALVGESVEQPHIYYQNNVVAPLRLLEAVRIADVKRFVFSSTAATYGEPVNMPITENEDQKPVNPYGFSKLVIEEALADYARAYGLGYAAMRYFNAAGASSQGDLGEDHTPESHLIPIVLQVALGQRESISIFGDDYATSDGTCVRDYVHVDDLAAAHGKALEKLDDGDSLELNLGTGTGYSVRQVIEACREVTGHAIPEVIGPRRPGDPPELVANSDLAKKTLNWSPEYQDIKSIVETAWNWHRANPHGYASQTASRSS